MLRSLNVFDANLVSLVHENPMYTKMSLEEVLGKFVSHLMMVKNVKYIDDVTNGSLPSNEPKSSLSEQQTTQRRSQARWHKLRRLASMARRWHL
jgi:hypothetical protein